MRRPSRVENASTTYIALTNTSTHPMKMAVATEAMFGSTMATVPPSRERTPAIMSQRRVRLSSSVVPAVETLVLKGVVEDALAMPPALGRRPGRATYATRRAVRRAGRQRLSSDCRGTLPGGDAHDRHEPVPDRHRRDPQVRRHAPG